MNIREATIADVLPIAIDVRETITVEWSDDYEVPEWRERMKAAMKDHKACRIAQLVDANMEIPVRFSW